MYLPTYYSRYLFKQGLFLPRSCFSWYFFHNAARRITKSDQLPGDQKYLVPTRHRGFNLKFWLIAQATFFAYTGGCRGSYNIVFFYCYLFRKHIYMSIYIYIYSDGTVWLKKNVLRARAVTFCVVKYVLLVISTSSKLV